MRAKKLTLAALALVAGLSLTACQGDDDSTASGSAGVNGGADSSNSSPGDGAGEGSSGGSGSGGDSGSDTSGGNGNDDSASGSADGSGGGQITAGKCKTADLAFGTAHGMGEGTLMVSLKNTGGDACSLKGFPGVDLKADSGPGAIGAERSDLAAPAVALKSGETTRFTLHYPRNDSGGSGLNITTLVVTPPDETHSKTLPVDINLPTTDKSVATVTVDPVGTGKQ